MKYYIDENNLKEILNEVFFESDKDIPSIIDIYKDKYNRIKDFPEDILLNEEYKDIGYVDIKNVEDFKEEMIIKLDCIWLDQVEDKLKKVLNEYNEIY